MKTVFMGTPDIADTVLRRMLDAGIEVAAAVTQPDKVRGRGHKVSYSPVKETALEHGIEVLQPVRIRSDEEVKRRLAEIAPDVIVVIAFGQIIPQDILDIPPLGCINIHASLLPKYRGAAPIQWAIINGETVTGVTTMQMNAGLDTGDMLLKEEVAIDPKDTGGTLTDKLGKAGASIILKTLEGLEAGTIVPQKQDDAQAGMYAKMLTKEMGRIVFTRPAAEIDRLIRGLNPWPSAYTKLNGRTLKIWDADPVETPAGGAVPGEVTKVDRNSFTVQTGSGALVVREVQMEGKKRMEAGAFLRGSRLTPGTVLGE
ncbi:MAG: methionyl-tRNA formyltransferase [Lachnospiraceae bacterium]